MQSSGKKIGDLRMFGLAKGLANEMSKATTESEKIHSIRQLQSHLESEIANSTKFQKESLESIIGLHEEITNQLQLQERSSLISSLGFKKFAQRYREGIGKFQSMVNNVKNFGTSVSNIAAKVGGNVGAIGARVGGMITGMGLKLAGLGIPVVGWITTAAILLKDLAMAIFDVFKQADEAAAKFRIQMGLTRANTTQIEKDVRSVAINLADVGVTFESAYQSVSAISQVMGSLSGYSKGLVETTSLFNAQLGVAADRSVSVAKAFAQTSRSTMSSSRNMLFFLARMSAAAGTNLSDVMGDIAEFSQSSYRFLGKSTLELAKAGIEARRMGTTLSSTGKTMSSLLNFTQSVNAEMEASVLLGKSVNLTRARSLAYMKDARGVQEEILRLAMENDFENMDPFQMQSFAAMLGKSEEELGKIVQAERERQKIEAMAMTDVKLRRQLDALNKLRSASEAEANNVGKKYEMDLRREANQARMVAIQNKWNQLIQKLAEDFLPVIDDILKDFLPLMEKVGKGIVVAIQPALGILKTIAGLLQIIAGIFTLSGESIVNGFETAGKGIVQMLAGSITKTMENIYDEWFKTSSPHKMGKGLIKGFENAIPGTERALTAPFEGLQSKMQEIRGVSENMLPVDSWTKSVETAYSKVVGLNNLVSNSISDLGDLTPPTINVNRPELPGIGKIEPIRPEMFVQQPVRDFATEEALRSIGDSIRLLRSDMTSGRVVASMNVDSQKVDTVTSRSTKFRQGEGTNDATRANYS
jgi:hypothetical protein